MSHKSTLFSAPHLRTPRLSVTEQVTRKVGSMAPPPFQSPSMPRRDTRIGLEQAQRTVSVSYSLTEAVAAVSAFLAAADHALVSAARYENANEEEKAQRAYARCVMLEYLAESTAKAARNSG